MKLEPTGNNILIRKIDMKEQMRGAIVLPSTTDKRVTFAQVIAIGPGERNDKGEYVQEQIKPGYQILLSDYSGTSLTLNGEEVRIINAGEVLAVVIAEPEHDEVAVGSMPDQFHEGDQA